MEGRRKKLKWQVFGHLLGETESGEQSGGKLLWIQSGKVILNSGSQGAYVCGPAESELQGTFHLPRIHDNAPGMTQTQSWASMVIMLSEI